MFTVALNTNSPILSDILRCKELREKPFFRSIATRKNTGFELRTISIRPDRERYASLYRRETDIKIIPVICDQRTTGFHRTRGNALGVPLPPR